MRATGFVGSRNASRSFVRCERRPGGVPRFHAKRRVLRGTTARAVGGIAQTPDRPGSCALRARVMHTLFECVSASCAEVRRCASACGSATSAFRVKKFDKALARRASAQYLCPARQGATGEWWNGRERSCGRAPRSERAGARNGGVRSAARVNGLALVASFRRTNGRGRSRAGCVRGVVHRAPGRCGGGAGAGGSRGRERDDNGN